MVEEAPQPSVNTAVITRLGLALPCTVDTLLMYNYWRQCVLTSSEGLSILIF